MAKDWSTLTQWTEKAIGLSEVRVQVRLRGNHLHVLCEASPCPSEKIAVSQFSAALAQTNLEKLLPADAPTVYKVFLCGRLPEAKRPEWTVKLEYNPQKVTEEAQEASQASAIGRKSVLETLSGIFTHRSPNNHAVESIEATELATETEPESVFEENSKPNELQEFETVFPTPTPPETTVAEPHQSPRQISDSPPLGSNGKRKTSTIPSDLLTSSQDSSEHHSFSSTVPNSRATATQTKPSEIETPSAPLTVSTETLARRGHPDAIASYLSEILGSLGVSVKVSVKEISKKRRPSPPTESLNPPLTRRLWVRCESAYSPDPSLLAEPIAQRLRQLQLENFRDACILLQVQGEPTPDWMLRIDLTPPLQILKNWARWGSEAAIARLLNQKLEALNVKVRATLKESTLHLFCETLTAENLPAEKSSKRPAPKQKVMAAIAPILETLAPQGILAATVYGVEGQNPKNQPDSPAWIDWLNLPASQYPDLQPHPLTLAQQGNLEALTFLLNQLVNRDLDSKLATGGVSVMLLRKGKLLHVMSEAPTCPSQSKVALPLAQFLRSHPIDQIAGVRIYGRRAGQKHPLWRYGVALSQRILTHDEQVNAFSEAESEDLIPQADGLVFRPDLVSDELEANESVLQRSDPLFFLLMRLQQSLLGTGLFTTRVGALVPVDASETPRYSKTALALVWGALGCLVAVQIDWAVGEFLENNPQFDGATEEVYLPSTPAETLSTSQEVSAVQLASPSSSAEEDGVFNRSEFISKSDKGSTQLNACQAVSDQESCQRSQLLYASFNSPQLDEQLARYQDFIAREKRPPDILIVGSSRALRGIDPEVLEQALLKQGYPQLKVFNFGVNGATAQVVELLVRRILPDEQLPKLVIVADGVRALNSGRSDRTYEALAASPGYQQIAQGTFRIPTRQLNSSSDFQQTLLSLRELSQNPSTVVKQVQQWFDQQLSEISASYAQRDRLKRFLLFVVNNRTLSQQPQALPDVPDAEDYSMNETPQLGKNGFLPLSIRFDPKTYYQKYSQVSGYYDSDYQGFELNGVQTNALKKLVEYVQSQQVEIVFVNMPLTQDYLDSVRMAYEQKFQEHMQQMESETGLIFIDLGLEWLQTYEYYSDPSHLNQYGAAAVAERLAEKQQIPWPSR
ncbi:DUF1574 family protein [Limnoraphis robusta]|uniref:DUF1574 family protein n=1 Tax=Limnoraphis robusta TaxID=1118279 RepID=UPI002B21E427|nr:DUF1574 family protein [Limnoraphis robusta]MEA5496103.1 DUF1574 family protein [Limnoraphis robusta BA-68 BA1]